VADPIAATEALADALAADSALWGDDHDFVRHRRVRNRAVASALAAGMPKERVADKLGVRISDLELMVADAGEPASST